MNQYAEPHILLCGDTGISVEFGNAINLAVNRRVQHLLGRLASRQPPGILGLNPTYRSLFIQYDPWQCSFEHLLLAVEEALAAAEETSATDASLIEIPVCYGGEFGPDLEDVASIHGLRPEEVIGLHCAAVYYVYMIGFTPGFPYLGGLDERLYTPRKKTPRKLVPAGSVAVADRQTGIYPIDSPGGWQLIGKTPLTLFDLERADPFYLHAGDSVRFKPITREAFDRHQHS
jgi:inhibitor of KinA